MLGQINGRFGANVFSSLELCAETEQGITHAHKAIAPHLADGVTAFEAWGFRQHISAQHQRAADDRPDG